MSQRINSLPAVLAGAALAISVVTAGAVGLERLSDWSLIQGEGRQTASPQSPFESDLASRILFPYVQKPDSRHDNHMISLGYNWHWDAEGGWSRPDPASPSVALTLESWFSGFAELNFDMRPPRHFTDWPGGRLMGFAARHDGTYATLSLGGSMFNPTGAGIKLTTGTSGEPLVLLTEGVRPTSSLLQIVRNDKLPSLSIQGGAKPSLAFGLSGTRADELAAGVLRFSGPLGDEPLINVVGTGTESTLLASAPGNDRETLAFRITAEGRLEWDAYRSEPAASLSVQGKEVVVSGGIATPLLRVGASGTGIHQMQLIPIELDPEVVRARGSSRQVYPVAGMSRDAVLVLNGPVQPDGIGIAGAHAMDDAITVAFVNAAAAPMRPSAGRYLVLAITATQ
jgi:hypothetical protein